jgi:hypothetical protein
MGECLLQVEGRGKHLQNFELKNTEGRRKFIKIKIK